MDNFLRKLKKIFKAIPIYDSLNLAILSGCTLSLWSKSFTLAIGWILATYWCLAAMFYKNQKIIKKIIEEDDEESKSSI